MTPDPDATEEATETAAQVHALLAARGETLAVAESLTGGAIGATITAVPGVSATFRGGIVAYDTGLKATLLGVADDLLAERGAVDPGVAEAMADGVRGRLSSTYGLAITGVAGPEQQDGHPPGEVYVAVSGPGWRTVDHLRLSGDRAEVRRGAVAAALRLLHEALKNGNAS